MSVATVRCKFVAAAKQAPCRTVTRTANSPKPRCPSRTARMLALAHHIERLIEAGDLSSYSEAAQAIGVTRARVSQVLRFLDLSPRLQERILVGNLRASGRRLRLVVNEPCWDCQALLLERVGG